MIQTLLSMANATTKPSTVAKAATSESPLNPVMTNTDQTALDTSSHNEPKYSNPIKQQAQEPKSKRTVEELIRMVKYENFDPTSLDNDEIIELMISRQVPVHKLESILGKNNAKRCVEIRRQYYIKELELLEKSEQLQQRPQDDHKEYYRSASNPTAIVQIRNLDKQSSKADTLRGSQTLDFDYDKVVGACCENVVGFVRLPVGIAGPLIMDDQIVYVPMATTEGCLVASTSRGLSALAKSGGVVSHVRKNHMTRAPIVRFRDFEDRDALTNVNRAIDWLAEPVNKEKIIAAFRSTSKHLTSVDYETHSLGRELHIRFKACTGDAMGMNMCSKGAEAALKEIKKSFPTMDILTLSGNMCTDKKPSAINWICGRGKSVECNALLPAEVIEKVFKVTVDSLIEVWLKKVMVGSALAGSIGGFNCHAANIVAAVFIATGQDTAQVVSSSNCIITLEKDPRGSLEVTCSMPSIECGTVGGGTVLPDQSSYLQLMGIKGSTRRQSDAQNSSYHDEIDSDSNACKLARIICSTVMAAELSLLASLTEGTLVKSHMTHNRSAQPCKVV